MIKNHHVHTTSNWNLIKEIQSNNEGHTLGTRQTKQVRPAFGLLYSIIFLQTPASHDHLG